MLDGPYANSTWNGREIAVINVDANAPREPKVYSIPVNAVEGLTGKHAIYLVVEGPEVQEPQQPQRPQFGRRQQPQRPQGLFDLHGLGFSKNNSFDVTKSPMAMAAPEVTITVDGQRLNIPATPIYSNNANGYTDATHYQVYAPLKDKSELKATANRPGVSFDISPIAAGRATIRATYQGKQKVFLIN